MAKKTSAHAYAQALLELATEPWLKGLRLVNRRLHEQRLLARLDDPAVAESEKKTLLASVLVPLLMLAGDGSRIFIIYTRLGAATDLACAELGYMLVDRQGFLTGGPGAGNMIPSLGELHIPVSASGFSFQLNGNAVQCTGRVTFPLLLLPGQEVTLTQVSADEVRFISP